MGDPVRHSLSPILHNAAFTALGLNWAYLAFEVGLADGAAGVAACRALGLEGLSITMPLKAVAAGSMDRLSPTAQRLGAVNTVVREGKVLIGHNTDGDGFLDALRRDLDWIPQGRRCLVVGAGGAARAVVLALADAGAAEVVVVNRSPGSAEMAATLAGERGRVGDATDAGVVDLVVNATPMGMAGVAVARGRGAGVGRGAVGGQGDAAPGAQLSDRVAANLTGSDQVVVDLVYHPLLTPFLETASQRGARTANGIGMLAYQAARAFELWTEQEAPRHTMVEAVTGVLTRATPSGPPPP